MSKNDTIGATVCSMAGMNPKFVGLVKDVAARLNMPYVEAAAWHAHINQAIQQGLSKPQPSAPPPLFEHMSDLDNRPFPGSVEFLFDDYFTTEPKLGTKKTFSYVGPNVKARFGGMQVPLAPSSQLSLDRLVRNEFDRVIVTTIGDEDCDRHLGEVRWMFKNGLLVKGRWYACYAIDRGGVRCTLFWGWDHDGWFLNAHEVPLPFGWDAGRAFVSRKRLVA